MLALFDRMFVHGKKLIGIAILVGMAVFARQVPTAQAVASCSFACVTRPTPDVTCNPAPDLQSETNAFCTQQCTDSCRALGMTVRTGFQGRCIPRDGGRMSQCIPCLCTPQVAFACLRMDAGTTPEPGEGNECPNRCGETCSTARYSDRLASAHVATVGCSDTYPGTCVEIAVAPTTRLAMCQSCINRCRDSGGAFGTIPSAANCYQGCSTSGDSVCVGVPQEQAVAGLTAPSGAVSGAGRSHVQSGVSAAANEAASLPPGACAQRAVASDAANVALIASLEVSTGAASTTWSCRRVCANLQEQTCVTGGCPGDSSIRCCPSTSGIAPALQCGGNGAANGAAGGTGDASQGGANGAANGGTDPSSPSQTASGGSTGGASNGTSENTVVGATHVAADSGGLTRLILPSCIEDGGCQFSDIIQVGLNLIRFLFGLSGVLLLVVFVYAGVEYLIAGDAASVKSAEERIKKALIGLFIMFFGYTLVNFLVGLFLGV